MTVFDATPTASEEESAAIAAVVAHVLGREAEVLADPRPRPAQSEWVMSWRSTVRPLRPRPQPPTVTPPAAPQPD